MDEKGSVWVHEVGSKSLTIKHAWISKMTEIAQIRSQSQYCYLCVVREVANLILKSYTM